MKALAKSHTHCQVARKAHHTSQNLSISMSLPTLQTGRKRKHVPPTMYIKNKRDSSSIKVYSPFELYCKVKVLCFGIAYFSYTARYAKYKE